MGIYEGTIEETRYLKVPNAACEQDYKLEMIDVVHVNRNNISFVYPPNADIHSVRNPSEQPAITDFPNGKAYSFRDGMKVRSNKAYL